eukprot:6261786-Amphidinium_carterae.2
MQKVDGSSKASRSLPSLAWRGVFQKRHRVVVVSAIALCFLVCCACGGCDRCFHADGQDSDGKPVYQEGAKIAGRSLFGATLSCLSWSSKPTRRSAIGVLSIVSETNGDPVTRIPVHQDKLGVLILLQADDFQRGGAGDKLVAARDFLKTRFKFGKLTDLE